MADQMLPGPAGGRNCHPEWMPLVGSLFDPTTILACFHETLRTPSCSRARFRHVGLACRARLRVEAAGVHIVLAAVRGNWLCMSLRGVRLQRRAGLARSIWSVRVTR